MPINKEEFEARKLHSKVEEEITSFLNERKEGAFTSQEIMGGIHARTRVLFLGSAKVKRSPQKSVKRAHLCKRKTYRARSVIP